MAVDIKRTRAWYARQRVEDDCDCAYCRNYRLQIEEAYPGIKVFLASIGVDIRRAHELMPVWPCEDGKILYISQYVVLGEWESGLEREIEGAKVDFADSYPAVELDGPFFVLEIGPVFLKPVIPLN